MASSSITSWKIDGVTVKTVTDFFFSPLSSKFTVDSDGSHEVKRCLLFGRKAMVKEKKRRKGKRKNEKKIERKWSCVWLFVTPWAIAYQAATPWNFLGKNTIVGGHFFLQGSFPTQASNPGLLHCRQMLYNLSHWGSPWNLDSMSKTEWFLLLCQ